MARVLARRGDGGNGRGELWPTTAFDVSNDHVIHAVVGIPRDDDRRPRYVSDGPVARSAGGAHAIVHGILPLNAAYV